MSGPPQTPIRYAPNQQFIGRPGTPNQMLGTPGQRPMMQYRPGMAVQTPPQMMMNRGGVTPQQAHLTQLQQQQHMQQQQQLQQQQQMMRPNMGQVRPNVQPFAYTGNTSMALSGVGVNGQQAHPSLIQQRKRKGKTDADESAGDDLDNLQPHSISLARYQNNHSLMSEIFVALPTSTIDVPKHYYEDVDRAQLEQNVEALSSEMSESRKGHQDALEQMQESRGEFAELVRVLTEGDADAVKRMAGERFGMEFVDNPYRTVERVAVDKVEAAENPVYKQL
ncbi:hypothetical protein IWW50_000782 [Coemansia erecta]|nr:hypothetical protein GGF43_004245 [Coemansia sp. RSA 2618]KAJ2829564.1 hypothetical protein IWW50_000782 [Coemansia erecta]